MAEISERWGWGQKVVVGTVGVVVGGVAVLQWYRIWFGMVGGMGGMLVDGAGVGVGAVVVHGLVRWGAEAARRWRGRRVWACVGGWFAGAVIAACLLAFPTGGCTGSASLWPVWVLAAGWWLSGDRSGSWGWRGWVGNAGLLLATSFLYAVTVFTVLPWEFGGARPVPAVLHMADGPAVGEAVRWRSGVWVFGSYCTAVGIDWSPAAGVDVTGLGTSARRIGREPRIEQTVLVPVEELP